MIYILYARLLHFLISLSFIIINYDSEVHSKIILTSKPMVEIFSKHALLYYMQHASTERSKRNRLTIHAVQISFNIQSHMFSLLMKLLRIVAENFKKILTNLHIILTSVWLCEISHIIYPFVICPT